ncbi:OB-fold-containig protein [Mesorhizobium sp. SP-1A]|uniref:OB-fold-containig protein n=1 Tax=Mesorhizobium sp. SP-1A TaxID=3077840 RepID=UPI0028F70F2B|nr:OB-fold-containig protein [Mesorhizobium sp. SP-1A]
MEFFTNPSFAPFAISFYILAGLLAIEVLMAVSGVGGSSFIDDFMPEIPEPPAGVFSFIGALHYFGIGKVPVLMLVAIFSGFFAASGLVIQSLAINILGIALPVWVAVIASIPVALSLTRPTSKALGKLLHSEKGHATSRQSLIGRVATITDGTASITTSASAKVYDAEGSAIDIYVKTSKEEHLFTKGDNVLIISIIDGFYLVSHSD